MGKKRGFRQETEASWKEMKILPAVVAAIVAVAALKAQFRREFLVAAMDPRNIAPVRLHVGALIGRKREGDDLPNSGAHAEEEAAHTLHRTVGVGGGIAF